MCDIRGLSSSSVSHVLWHEAARLIVPCFSFASSGTRPFTLCRSLSLGCCCRRLCCSPPASQCCRSRSCHCRSRRLEPSALIRAHGGRCTRHDKQYHVPDPDQCRPPPTTTSATSPSTSHSHPGCLAPVRPSPRLWHPFGHGRERPTCGWRWRHQSVFHLIIIM
jgi:hypothetical protein